MTDETTATDDTSADSQETTDVNETTETTADEVTTEQTTEQQPGAPETYADFTLPEGTVMNEEIMGEFSTLAKDANLTQEKAQSLVELGAKMAKGFESAAQQSLTDLKESFATDLAKDTELGGENLDANLAIAKRALDAFGSEELKTMLTDSGLEKHPELVRFFYAVGKTVAEDTTEDNGANVTGGQKSLAERMYGTEAAA